MANKPNVRLPEYLLGKEKNKEEFLSIFHKEWIKLWVQVDRKDKRSKVLSSKQ